MLRKNIDAGRYLLVLPDIGSLLLTVAVVVVGLGMILVKGWEAVQAGDYSAKAAKHMSITVIETIDLFLVYTDGFAVKKQFHISMTAHSMGIQLLRADQESRTGVIKLNFL